MKIVWWMKLLCWSLLAGWELDNVFVWQLFYFNAKVWMYFIIIVVYKGVWLSNSQIIGEKPKLILDTLSNQHTLNWTHATWLMCLFCNERERGKSQDTQDSPVCSGIKRTPNPALFVTTGLRVGKSILYMLISLSYYI